MTDRRDPQPLDYRDGRQELRPLANRVLQAIGGAVIGFVAVSILLLVWGIANTHWVPKTPVPFNWKGPLLISGIVLSLLGLAVYAIYRGERMRWFAIGMLLGIGVTMLAEGLCFGLTYGR